MKKLANSNREIMAKNLSRQFNLAAIVNDIAEYCYNGSNVTIFSCREKNDSILCSSGNEQMKY